MQKSQGSINRKCVEFPDQSCTRKKYCGISMGLARAQTPGKPVEKTFLWHYRKTWKTWNLKKIFQIPLKLRELCLRLVFWLTYCTFVQYGDYFKWHSSLSTLYPAVIAGSIYWHIYLVWVIGCCLKWPTLTVLYSYFS